MKPAPEIATPAAILRKSRRLRFTIKRKQTSTSSLGSGKPDPITPDTLFMIGTSFPYMEFLPKPGKARGVQIDIDPADETLDKG